jgi:hypothetical protein
MLQITKKISLIILVLFALIACAGQGGIVVDTTGMTPEQVEAVNWRVKYGAALDWYEWELSSLKANLDLLPQEEAMEIYEKMLPLIIAVRASINGLGAIAYGSDPNVDPQEAYDQYFKAKQALLAALMTAFNKEE